MVDDDGNRVVGDKGLQFGLQFLDEGGIVVDGDVGHHIDGNAALILKVVEAVDLLDVLVGGSGLHEGLLQLGALVLARGDGIHAHSHDDAVAVEHFLADATREAMNLVGIHRVLDVDVQGADLHIGTIIVDNDVKHAIHSVKVVYLLLDLREQFRRNLGTEQFVDGGGEHLDTCLDDDQRDEGTQDAVERNAPQQHHTSRDERGQGDDGIEQGIGA